MFKTLKKTYLITSTLQVRCNADMSLSKIICDASFSPAIKVGSDTQTTGKLNFIGPNVLSNTSKIPYAGWGPPSVPYPDAVGIQVVNVNDSDITTIGISGFCVGLQVAAKDTANTFNTYRLGNIIGNQKNIQVICYGDGWVNQNYFVDGTILHLRQEADMSNTREVEIIRAPGATWGINGNVFLNCTFEGNFSEYKVYLNGSDNMFIGCRWEGSSVNVAFAPWSQNNMFIGGWGVNYIKSNSVNLGAGITGNVILGGGDALADGSPDNPVCIKFYNSSVAPDTDSVWNLGTSTKRWNTIYAVTGTIETSDEREKTQLIPIEEAERNAALKIKSMIGKFQFLDAIDKKGEDGARIHFGTTAQAIARAFESEGLDPHKYAMFCYDEWEADPSNCIEAGNRYGIRYNELLAFLIAAI